MTTGERIKELREKAGLTQEELADKADVQRNTVWRWENQRANLTSKNVNKLSEIFNVAPSDLMWLSPIKASQPEERTIGDGEDRFLSPLLREINNNVSNNRDVFSFECNGQRVEIPASKDFEGLFLEVVRDMRSNSAVTVNNNAEAHDNGQAVAVGDGIKKYEEF